MTTDKIFQLAQNFITFVVATTAFIPIAGYFVFHTSIARYTDLYAFEAKSHFYVVAGLSVLLASALIVAALWIGSRIGDGMTTQSEKMLAKRSTILQKLFLGFILTIGIMIMIAWFQDALIFVATSIVVWGIVIWATMSTKLLIRNEGESRADFIVETLFNPFKVIQVITKKPLTISTIFLVLALVFYLNFVSVTYAQVLYNLIPASAGGGKPSVIRVIVNEPAKFEDISFIEGDSSLSSVVCLIAQLGDSYLLYNPNTKTIVELKANQIISIFDDRASASCDPPSF